MAAGEEATVAAWIRRRRLDAARGDLADPALDAVPIHAIAARWGFPRAAVFTRAFRSAYGIPPRDYRCQRLILEADCVPSDVPTEC
ncbi:helix-turn-helix domain-containing protein [Streptomyces sp. NPDC048506]|uniref:helix-turn-helix domain-containing protein n=1 Tax=Streptomyces sp. NPDC048506 TaxID=3155028 RepID=UPI0034161A8C